ncbi:MAG: polymer-forming cytoskeletal protein [Planctomycetes bacterium]|nr:polymer-forming cytoskeletal protein [Planctomycetota bacterium]
MPLVSKEYASGSKTVVCTHCQNECEVSRRAMSIFCPHCRKRLILEDYAIKNYTSVRELVTCGDVVVEKRGHVRARIKAGNLTVRGKIQGDVTARGSVKIGKTGHLIGDLEASVLEIEGGAVLKGFLRIGGAPPAKT